MFRPRIIPVLTLKGKGLVKTVRFGREKTRYIGDPINAVRLFNEFEADELIFLDIRASLEKRCIDQDLVKKIGEEAYMPFAVGGGISDISQIRSLISSGAEKVVINTACSTVPGLITRASDLFGKQSIVAAVDIKRDLFRKNCVYISDGKIRIKTGIEQYIKSLEEMGAGELFINSMDRDGTMRGYDLDLIKSISTIVSIPVIACGGAGGLEDIRRVTTEANASAAGAGSLFVFHGKRDGVLINYPEKRELSRIFEFSE